MVIHETPSLSLGCKYDDYSSIFQQIVPAPYTHVSRRSSIKLWELYHPQCPRSEKLTLSQLSGLSYLQMPGHGTCPQAGLGVWLHWFPLLRQCCIRSLSLPGPDSNSVHEGTVNLVFTLNLTFTGWLEYLLPDGLDVPQSKDHKDRSLFFSFPLGSLGSFPMREFGHILS